MQHLPPGGAAYRAVQGHGWVEQHYMLADLIDAAAQNVTAVYRVNAGRKKVASPRRYPRPGDERTHAPIGDRGEHSTEEVVSYLDTLKPLPKGA